jgi:hypothetical protein
MAEMRNAYEVLVRKPEGKRYRWKDNIKLDLEEAECEDVDWIHLAHDRVQCKVLVNIVNETMVSIKGGEFLDQLSNY